MSEATEPTPSTTTSPAAEPVRRQPETEEPGRIFLVPYPKIVFLYPTFFMALIAAIYLSIRRQPLDAANTAAVVLSAVFLVVLAANLVVLAFDFPRTTSLTLFFLVVAFALAAALLFVLKPNLLPQVTHVLVLFHPLANATFYWAVAVILGVTTAAAWVHARFDYWEVRPNELLHHHGLWGNLERFPSPGLRIDKEINDVFEYLLLRSGRLILHLANERRAIILDNIPFVSYKEEMITRMLGALQVEVRDDEYHHHV